MQKLIILMKYHWWLWKFFNPFIYTVVPQQQIEYLLHLQSVFIVYPAYEFDMTETMFDFW